MFKFLIHFISQSLEFSKSEAKGTLGLIFIISVSFTAANIHVSYLEEKNPSNPTQHAALKEWADEVRASVSLKRKKEVKSIFNADRSPHNADFNKKVHTSDLSPSPDKGEEKKSSSKEVTRYKDLNTATKEALQEIRGIGPAFSERIIKYRNLLGGFASLNQLKEVYGLKEETINELSKQYEVSSPPTPLNINSDSVKLLAKHPYISYDLAWTIFNYRKQHGDLRAEDLKKIKSLDEDILKKLQPYLTND